MPGLSVALMAAIGLILIGIVAATLSSAAARGTLPRNATTGIRTAATLATDEAWEAGHRAALPGVVAARRSALGGAAVVLAAGLAGLNELWTVLIAVLGYALAATFLVRAVLAANRAARATLDNPADGDT